jgi:RNA polymerase sigma factor (TIGR02999 family)
VDHRVDQQGHSCWTPDGLDHRVYAEMHRLACMRLARAGLRRTGGTLQVTVLVHEAFLRLADADESLLTDKGRFLAAASIAMRDIIVEYCRRRARHKRGGGRCRMELSSSLGIDAAAVPFQLLALNEALERLETLDARKAQVVMLRYFAGCSVEQTAEALGISTATVKREWAFARAWLYSAIRRGARDSE